MTDFPPAVEKLMAGQWSVRATVSVAAGSGRHLDVLSVGQAEPVWLCRWLHLYVP